MHRNLSIKTQSAGGLADPLAHLPPTVSAVGTPRRVPMGGHLHRLTTRALAVSSLTLAAMLAFSGNLRGNFNAPSGAMLASETSYFLMVE